jgi:hypothetical protein
MAADSNLGQGWQPGSLCYAHLYHGQPTEVVFLVKLCHKPQFGKATFWVMAPGGEFLIVDSTHLFPVTGY